MPSDEYGEPTPDPHAPSGLDGLSAEGARVAVLCSRFLQHSRLWGVTGVHVSRCIDGGLSGVLHASDAVATQLEALQATLADSPARVALSSGGPVLVSDFDDEPPGLWIAFSAEAQQLGISSVYAVPITVGAITLGVVTAHGTAPMQSSPSLTAQVFRLADMIGSSLLAPHGADSEPSRWQGRLLGKAQMTTHQAAGMVMVQSRGTLKDAMVILRAAAFSSGVSLEEIARQVVSRERSFAVPDSHIGSSEAETGEGCGNNG